MLQVYLPIVEVHVNILYLLLISGFIGFLSGLLGIGGGFLMTPVLIFFGIPPMHAIANGSNNILASSVSGTFAHWYKKQVDIKMGLYILIGGFFGATIGIYFVKILIQIGKINTITSVLYFVLLTGFGLLMFIESLSELRRIKSKKFIKRKFHKHTWIHGLPFKVRLNSSRLYISIIPPIFFGFLIGIISSVMIFVMAFVTFFHAITNHNIDLILVSILMIGSVIGVQFGTRLGMNLKNEELRILMSVIIIIFGLKFAYSLFVEELKFKIFRKIESQDQLNFFQDFIYQFVNTSPILYALTAVGLALLIGYFSSFIFKKLQY
ncbi:MAG: sulfite exporter TauE/SafE family protein [Candidatus Fonsibacter ubiquis]|nr:sulfite exporter TauE/SafE family protein [Candidatus Fonsibacter ubiquis]